MTKPNKKQGARKTIPKTTLVSTSGQSSAPDYGVTKDQALVIFAILTEKGMTGSTGVNHAKVAARIGRGWSGKKSRRVFRAWLKRCGYWQKTANVWPVLRGIEGFDARKYGDKYEFKSNTFAEDDEEAGSDGEDSEDGSDESVDVNSGVDVEEEDEEEEEEEEEDDSPPTPKKPSRSRNPLKKKLQAPVKKRKAVSSDGESSESEADAVKTKVSVKKRKY